MNVKLHPLFIIGQTFTTYFLPGILTAVAPFCQVSQKEL